MKEVEGGRSNVQNTMIGQISVKGVAVHMVYSEKRRDMNCELE